LACEGGLATWSSEDALIELLVSTSKVCPIELSDYPSSCSLAQLIDQRWRAEESHQRIDDCLGVTRGHQDSSIAHYLGRSSGIRGDDSESGAHGFLKHRGRALSLRRKYEYRTVLVETSQLLRGSVKPTPESNSDSQLVRQILQRGSIRTVSNDMDLHIRANGASCLDKILNAFELVQSRHHQNASTLEIGIKTELLATESAKRNRAAAVWDNRDFTAGMHANARREIV
jgi:hypothetical protein